MSKYELEELSKLWRLQRLSIEQAVGQLTLHAQEIAQQVPTQAEVIEALKERLNDAEQNMAQLKRDRHSSRNSNLN